MKSPPTLVAIASGSREQHQAVLWPLDASRFARPSPPSHHRPARTRARPGSGAATTSTRWPGRSSSATPASASRTGTVAVPGSPGRGDGRGQPDVGQGLAGPDGARQQLPVDDVEGAQHARRDVRRRGGRPAGRRRRAEPRRKGGRGAATTVGVVGAPRAEPGWAKSRAPVSSRPAASQRRMQPRPPALQPASIRCAELRQDVHGPPGRIRCGGVPHEIDVREAGRPPEGPRSGSCG